MAIQSSSPNLIIRLSGHAISPSDSDANRIKAALGVVVEVLESLLKLLGDERTAQAYRDQGNGKARRPEIGDIARTADEALGALEGRELVVEELQTIQSDLREKSDILRQSFEESAEDFTPRPVDQAAAHMTTGAILAGLLETVGVFDQLLSVLESLNQ